MDSFNYEKGHSMARLKQPKALQTISEWGLNRKEELEYMIVKYEHYNDWTVNKMNPCREMTEL